MPIICGLERSYARCSRARTDHQGVCKLGLLPAHRGRHCRSLHMVQISRILLMVSRLWGLALSVGLVGWYEPLGIYVPRGGRHASSLGLQAGPGG